MATPTIREVVAAGQVGDVAVNTGVGTAAGDLLVILHGMDWDTAADMGTPTVSAGVSTPTLRATGDRGTNTPHIKIWTAQVTSGGAKTITSVGVAADSQILHVHVLSGASATPEDAQGSAGSNATDHVAPSATATSTDGLLICAACSWNVGSYTPPAEMTEQADTGVSTFADMASATQALSASGATGTRTFTKGAPTSADYASVSVIVGGGASIAPAGISVPLAPGSPSATWSATATPDGIPVGVQPGSPTLAWSGSISPDGLSVPVSPGAPAVGIGAINPDGIAVPAAVGSPTLAWSAVVSPAGIAVPIAPGAPGLSQPGQTIVRPFTGTVTRPSTGIVTRPNTGMIVRPSTGTITRPDTGTVARP